MKIGLALAGGGLKGIAHIGAYRALEELGVKIDYISGTSSRKFNGNDNCLSVMILMRWKVL